MGYDLFLNSYWVWFFQVIQLVSEQKGEEGNQYVLGIDYMLNFWLYLFFSMFFKDINYYVYFRDGKLRFSLVNFLKVSGQIEI